MRGFGLGWGAAVIGGAILAGCGTPASAGPEGRVWIAPRNVVVAIGRNQLVRTELRRGHLIEVVRWGQRVVSSVPASPALSLKSLASARLAMARIGSGSAHPVLLLDIEKWPQTPSAEQRSPIATVQTAAALARSHHLELVVNLGLDLISLTPGHGRPAWQRYLDRRWLARAAALASVVVIPAQSLETDPGVYGRFVRGAAQQARGAQAGITVVAGLTGTRGVTPALGGELARCVELTARVVNGYYLNIPQPSLARLVLARADAVSGAQSRAP